MAIYYRQHNDLIIISGKTYPYKDDIKACGGRFQGPEKVWSVPDSADNLQKIKLLCKRVGGGPLKIKTPTRPNIRPELELGSEPGQVAELVKQGLTVSELMTKVQLHIQHGFPGTIWIIGEIQSLNLRHTGTYLQLADFKDGASKSATMTVNATVWRSTSESLSRKLKAPLSDILQEGMKIRALVQVGFYKDRGSISLNILDIDPNFTKGALALEREKILKELRAKGLDRKNKSLSGHAFPFNIGLLSADGSRAKTDFLDQLKVYKYPGKVTFLATQMQGEKTVSDIVAGIQTLAQKGCDYIIVTRGGGSNADLRWFDDRAIALAIAESPVPIIAAIGHHDDICIAEEIAFAREKTPTAAADFILSIFANSQERISNAQQKIYQMATNKIHNELKVQLQRGEQIKGLSERYLSQISEHLTFLSSQIQGQYHRAMTSLGTSLSESKRSIDLLSQKHVSRHSQFLSHIQYNLTDRFKAKAVQVETRINRLGQNVRISANEYLVRQSEILNNYKTLLVAKDPGPWLKQGWTQLTQDSKIILTIKDINPDKAIQARLLDGKIELKILKEQK